MSAVPPNTPLLLTGALLWHAIDGDWVVYQPDTGAIAQIDTLGAAVLTLLELAPATLDELAAQLAADTGSAPDAVRAELAEVVAALAELRLLAEHGGAPAW